MAVNRDNASGLSLDGLRISRPPLSGEDAKLRLFLLQHAREFVTVDKLREKGWSNPQGDLYYEKKRQIADQHIRNADQEMLYFDVYLDIAREVQTATGVFTVNDSTSGGLRGFNLCMAPGGYTKILLEHNPQMAISGITLPEALTGHPVMAEVAEDPRVEVQYLDINLLATSMGVTASEIPADHPDATKFLIDVPFAGLDFDVVIADGAVLRTHDRGEHRLDREREALRLRLAQLILGFGQIKNGGTFMLLLHRIDSWGNFELLRKIEEFSEVQVYKPKEKHAQSSSFYLVAKNVDRDRLIATAVLDEWKASWRQATFGGEGGKGELPGGPGDDVIEKEFQDYGARFMELGRPVWEAQARALEKASYMRSPGPGNPSGRPNASRNTAARNHNRGPAQDNASAASWRDGPRPTNENVGPTWRRGPRPSQTRAGDNANQTSQADNSASKSETSAKPTRPPAASLPSWR
ncbi:MAG: hypothetical protein Q9195_004077 [Heterodermia aff. obscurata]